jgi:uncharacterized protein
VVTLEPAVFTGTLRHRRLSPVPHEFAAPLFMVLLDIDRLPELLRVSRFTSYNRWNWASYQERDHFGDPLRALRDRLAADAARHGLDLPDGPIFLLTHLRYLGYCFNPVSFFYCFDQRGTLDLVMAEVNNTFGGSHNYWLRPNPMAGGAPRSNRGSPMFRATAAKSLYVSPFMDADLDYHFAFTAPSDRVVAHMRALAGDRPRFEATLSLDRRAWSAAEIRRALVRHPWMTAAVMGRIHWEALRLWWKGVPVVPRPTRDGTGVRDAVIP